MRDRYVWLYQKEAKKLTFKKPYSSIPSEYNPIVIGSFFTKKYNEMYLEARSIERAIEGIVFFDTYIKTYMAKIEDISIVNKMFSPEENTMDFTDLFDKEVIIDPEEKLNKLKANVKQGKPLDSIFNETGKELLPEVERFPSHFYEGGRCRTLSGNPTIRLHYPVSQLPQLKKNVPLFSCYKVLSDAYLFPRG